MIYWGSRTSRLVALAAAVLTTSAAAHPTHHHGVDHDVRREAGIVSEASVPKSIDALEEQPHPLRSAIEAQARHDFSEALAIVEEHLRSHPRDDQALLQKMALHLIRGEPEHATAACRRLSSSSVVVVLACHARIAHHLDEPDAALNRLAPIAELVRAGELATEQHAWVLAVVGDLAASSGQRTAARAWYQRSLSLDEQPTVRAALVETFIADAAWSEAAAWLQTGASLTLDVQRLIVDKALGIDTSARRQAMQAQFAQWLAADDFTHAREMARFFIDVVDDAARAEPIAVANARLQHEPEDRILLARIRQH